MFSEVGDSAKKYKAAIFKPKRNYQNIEFFRLVHQHIQVWFVEKPGAEYLKLGPL
jgi:hypothetical protein